MGAGDRAALIRLLIDECLSPRLTTVAYARGLEATHVNHLGLARAKDHVLLPVIVGGDYTFVTNNRADFLRLYRYVDVHAGLLIIVPSCPLDEQENLLGLALDAIAARAGDTINQLCEVQADGRVEFSQWPFEPNN